jgi:hypothetical protein
MYQLPTPEIQGFMMPNELQWLYDTAKRYEAIVEVGSWKGRSTHALLSGTNGVVFAVDHFKGNPEEMQSVHGEAQEHDIHALFLENTKDFDNLVVMKMESGEAALNFEDSSVDMIFIDGSHTYENARRDIELWLPKCYGLFCGHDFEQAHIQQIANDLGITVEKIGIGSLWVAV